MGLEVASVMHVPGVVHPCQSSCCFLESPFVGGSFGPSPKNRKDSYLRVVPDDIPICGNAAGCYLAPENGNVSHFQMKIESSE